MSRALFEQAEKANVDGDFESAMLLYQQCIDSDLSNAEAYRELGLLCYRTKKDPNEAIRLLRESLSLEDSADGHLYLALVLEYIKSKNEARTEFSTALRGYEGQVANPLHGLARFFTENF
jgi:tetratricopeptide (TPR) repeat protein